METTSISQAIKAVARAAGFDHSGIATLESAEPPELARFPTWIENGHAGEMEYLKKRTEGGELQRAALRNVAPWARSVIVCARSYDSHHPLSTECHDTTKGWIARYAWTREDYHDSVMRRLRQVEAALADEMNARDGTGEGVRAETGSELRTRCYVDTGPLLERVYARHAGIGWIGKNTCLISQQIGSFTFLGVILTSLTLGPDLPAPDRCGTCTRCIDACPTDALIAPGELDSRRCIAYLTIEKRGTIDEELRAGMGRHIFGCDICQDVCPWNTKARKTAYGATQVSSDHRENEAHNGAVRDELVNPALEYLASLSLEDFRAVFRRSPIKRTKFSGFLRNLAIAMGNSGDRSFLPKLREWSQSDDSAVAEHARWAEARLKRAEPRIAVAPDGNKAPATRKGLH